MSPFDSALLAERSMAVERHLRRVADRLPSSSAELQPATDAADAVVLHEPGGDLLHVQVRYSGSGALRDDVLLAWRADHWQEIDTLSWIKSIRLPPCYGLWKGPFLDLAALKLEMDVWIDGDGNCCPTGGRLLATFAVEKDALAVVEWRHVPGDGSPSDPGRGIDPARCGQEVLPRQ